MAKTKKKPSAAKLAVEIVIFIVLLALIAALMIFRIGSNTPDPAPSAQEMTDALAQAAKNRIPAGTGSAKLISDAAEQAFELKLSGVEKLGARKAELKLELRVVDWDKSLAALEESFDTALYNRVDAAKARRRSLTATVIIMKPPSAPRFRRLSAPVSPPRSIPRFRAAQF